MQKVEAMTVAIVVIGNEILSGKITDLNSNYLIQEFRKLGVTVGGVFILPDEEKTIAALIKRIHPLFDFVFTTGGIGPTHDDVTMSAIAHGLGTSLERNNEYEGKLKYFFGDEIKEHVLSMAELPKEAEIITEDKKLIPIVKVKNIYVLPGYPPLFKEQFESIKNQFKQEPFEVTRIFVTIKEEEISAILEQASHVNGEVEIGSYPDYHNKHYKNLITIESKNTKANKQVQDFLLERIPKQFIYKID